MTLCPRDASLRNEALVRIANAAKRLVGPTFSQDAFRAALYDHPGRALQRIKAARAHLTRAEAALRKWAWR